MLFYFCDIVIAVMIMKMEEMLNYKNFVVCGKTLDENSFAYKISNALKSAGYNVNGVYSEYKSFNDIEGDIDIIDMCINPVVGLKLLKENKKYVKGIILQPNTVNDELLAYLVDQGYDFVEDCVLVGLKGMGK